MTNPDQAVKQNIISRVWNVLPDKYRKELPPDAQWSALTSDARTELLSECPPLPTDWTALDDEQRARLEAQWSALPGDAKMHLLSACPPLPVGRLCDATDPDVIEAAAKLGLDLGDPLACALATERAGWDDELRASLKRAGLPESLADIANGWSDDELCILIDHPDMRAVWCEPPAFVFEVVQHGEVDPAILARQIEIGISPFGQSTPPGRWKRQPMTVAQLISMLSDHRAGIKDGNCFLDGPAIDGKRQANAIPHLDLLTIDLDTGEDIDAMRAKLQALGLFAIVYTTHSHLKPITEIKKDDLVKWLDGEANFYVDQAVAYLIQKKRYQPSVLEGAVLLGTEHTAEGIKVKVRHREMPKFRVVLLLKDRFVIADRAATQQEAIKEWKERYAGASKMLDAYFDRTCVDPSRLFFTPRHPKDAREWRVEIIAGRPLDINDCERVTAEDVRKAGLTPMERAAEEMRGNKGREYVTDNIKRFFAKFADRFEVESFLLDVEPDGDRGARTSGVGRVHRCPNDGLHSDAGSAADKGFFCVNATESDTGSAVASCSHDSCATLDRIGFVDLVCERVGITDAMELKKRWVPETIEDQEEEAESEEDTQTSDKPANHAYKNYGEAKRAAEALKKDDHESAGYVAANIGMTSTLTPSEMGALKNTWVKRSGLSARTYNEEVKRGRQLAKDAGDDMDEVVKEFNKTHCVFVSQTKVEVLRLAKTPGRLPGQYDFRNFVQLKDAMVEVGKTDTGLPLRAGAVWFKSQSRREVDKMDFAPTGADDLPADTLNLWNGWPVLKDMRGLKDQELEAKCDLYLAHLRDVVTNSDKAGFEYLLDWWADIFQFPGRKLGTAVTLVGGFGSGKSTMWECLIPAFGDYLLKANRADQINANHNEHKVCKLCIVSEEATYAGDKAGANQGKDETTSDLQFVNPKFRSGYVVHDYARRLYLANDIRQAVEVAEGDRRVTVFRTSDKFEKLRKTDPRAHHAYFRALREQMKGDGLAAFVALMRCRKINEDMLRNAYETDAKRAMMRGQGGPAVRWIIDSVRLGGFSSTAYGGLPVVLAGDGVAIVKHGGKDMVALRQPDMRLHFLEVLRQAPERWEARNGTIEALGQLLHDLLGADDPVPANAKVDGQPVKCWFVPTIDVIRATLAERGYLTAGEATVDTGEVSPWRWSEFGREARDATDAALEHLQETAGEGVRRAVQAERERMEQYEAHRDGTDPWDREAGNR